MDFRITATPHLGKPIKGVHAVPDRQHALRGIEMNQIEH
jgi:hypothetical protein